MSDRSGVGMIGVAALTFGLGLVFGGLAPRAEVRSLQQEVFELKRAAAHGGSRSQIADLITRGLPRGGGSDDDAAAPDRVAPPPDGKPGGDAQVDPQVDPTAPPDGPAGGTDDPSGLSEEDLEAAKAAMALRASQARAALIEDAEPSEAQLAAIDEATERMNARLEELALQFFDQVEQDREPDRRALYRMAADTMDAFVQAEDDMLAALTPEQQQAVRLEATDPTSFVDDRVVGLLAEFGRRQRGDAP